MNDRMLNTRTYRRFTLGVLVLVLAALASFFALTAHAQVQYVPLEPLPGLTTASTFGEFLQAAFRFGLVGAAFLAVIMIGIGGFEYLGRDSVFGKSEGKSKILSAVLGLLLLLISVLILQTINPKLLNLNLGLLNIGKLETFQEQEPVTPSGIPSVGTTFPGIEFGDLGSVVFDTKDTGGKRAFFNECRTKEGIVSTKCYQPATQKCERRILTCEYKGI